MTIPLDTYFVVDPSGDFLSKAHGVLVSQELFFYVSDTNELRVKAFSGNVAYAIAQNVSWCSCLTASNHVDVWYADLGGNIFYIPYFHFGAGTLTPVSIGIGSAVTFDVFFCLNSSPQVYALVVDNGIQHIMYTSLTPGFSTIQGHDTIFTNATDPAHYVTRPRIAMHPLDTDEMTVHCQRIVVQSGISYTGFYVTKVPGVS